MAEKALKKLEDQLNCPICLDTYTDPKQLQCNHVYCRQCLVKLVIRDQQGQLILTCPNCRQVTPVPASGVAGLQAAFRINQLIEIVGEHKKADTTASAGESTSIGPSQHGNTTVGCPEHKGIEVVLYCETCGETICWKCIKKGEKHHSHDYEELKEAFEKYLKEINSSLEPMEKQLVTVKKALAQLDTRCEKISYQQATIEANMDDTFTRLHQTLDARKTELIGQLHRLTQDKLKSLAVQRDQIDSTRAQLSSCLLFMRENLKTGNQGEALLMKSTTVRQVNELITTFQPDLLESKIEADMTFSTPTDITAVIQNYGHVHKQGSPDPSKCTATGKGVEEAAVGEKSTVFLQTLSFDGRLDNLPRKEALDSITCKLVSEMTGTRVGGSVERRGQSQYEISYQPTIKGRHQLHIKVKGQHIRGSPFSVAARSPVEMLGTPILTIDRVRGPEGVAVSQRGEVVVAESHGHCVSVFSPSGKRLRSFGCKGSGRGNFKNPYGVAIDCDGCILVADRGNCRIQKFTMEGQFLSAAGTEGNGPLQFSELTSITYNPINDKIFLGDSGNYRVQILSRDLCYVSSFRRKGRSKGELSASLCLACDSTGNVYVSDFGIHTIQVFTSEGEYIKKINTTIGSSGLTIDSSDRLYSTITSVRESEVVVSNSDGVVNKSFGGLGSEPGQFKNPTGIAVDRSGVVYVSDLNNNRIQVF